MSVSDFRGDIDAAREAIEAAEEGQSIEELAAAATPEDEEGQQLLDFGDHLNLAVKGSKPTDSEIKIKAISRPIRGQLGDSNDDEVVTLMVTARLDQINIVSKRDGDGRVTAKTRRHTFTPISVLPLTAAQSDRALGLE